jgi:uncharacterized protein (DUF697 family)
VSKRKLPRAIVAEEPGLTLGYAAIEREPAAPESRDNVIDIASKKERARIQADAAPANPDAQRRRARALAIVNHHATFAALGGCIPLPLANFASVTALMVHMVKSLSRHYAVPFERDRARAIVVGLVGGAMPSGLGAVTASSLLYVIPASALVGLAVSSTAAAACTKAVGRIFVEHFESGATLRDIAAP